MSNRFGNQGGAATSDPAWLRRALTSEMMRRLGDPRRRARQREKEEARRLRAGEPHHVEYFHQADDPYSQLSAQLLERLAARYDIRLECRITHGAQGPNAPEPALLAAYARRDAAMVAPHYGLEFPHDARVPDSALLLRAQCLLAAAAPERFAALARTAGRALWEADAQALARLEATEPALDTQATCERLRAGNVRLSGLGHYAGAMFHYGGEWYWGVDRLYHLEQRLIALGAARDVAAPLLAPRPAIDAPARPGDGTLTLEFFASLRSPYTSIVYDRALQLARESGLRLVLRPVLPMVMRGVPVTVDKGRYIFFDTGREAETLGLLWGNASDPIGEPVRRVYSLLPWAQAQGRAEALFGAALHGAFFGAVKLGTDKGLRRVVEQAGLAWGEALAQLGSTAWQESFEQNRLAMYAAGLWGVPSFRLLDASGNERLAVWGQDRLWLLARQIASLLAEPAA